MEYNAIILLDELGGQHYATAVEQQRKTIETRMRKIIPEGDVVICCSNRSRTKNSGLALCIVKVAPVREMQPADEKDALIECVPGRYAYDLSNWRYFSRKFQFTKHKTSGTFQAIFKIQIPEGIKIHEEA